MLEVMIVAAPLRDLLPPQHLRSRIVLIAALVSLAFAAFTADPRPAAAGGVHFDPESPAGKEYALPLAQARNEGAGKTGIGADGTVEPAPLFGEGVPSGAREGRSPAGDRDSGRTGGRADVDGSRASPTPAHRLSSLNLPEEDGYSTVTGALLVGLVLVVGLSLGLGLIGLGRMRST